MEIALPPDELLFIAKAAALFTPAYDVVLYGSRARGDFRRYSDVDIAVFGAPAPFDVEVTRLYSVLNNSEMTVQPKIVQISSHKARDFVLNVLEDGILVYEGCGRFREHRREEGFGTTPQPLFVAESIPTLTKRPIEQS